MAYLLVFLLGLSIVSLIGPKLLPMEKIGISIPTGLGIITIFMFLFDVLGIKVNNIGLILITTILLTLVTTFFLYKRDKSILTLDYYKTHLKVNFSPINLGWLFIMGNAVYILYGIGKKALFWPVSIYDSIAGYEFIAKAVLAEGTLNNSVFSSEYPLHTVRSIYPPFTPLSFSFNQLIGFESSKEIMVIFFTSVFVSLYSLIKRSSTHISAALFSLLLIITPQFAAFSALSSPNPMTTFFSSIGLLFIYIGYTEKSSSHQYIGILLCCLSLWVRAEAIIFVATGGLILLIQAIKEKKYMPLIVLASLGFTLFFSWQWYLSSVLQLESSQPIIKYLYWDGAKLSRMMAKIEKVTFNPEFYGIIVYLFLGFLIINLGKIIKFKQGILLAAIVIIPWLLYAFVYYQIDVQYVPGEPNWIENGYRRGFFYFLPLMLYYCAKNVLSENLFTKHLTIEK